MSAPQAKGGVLDGIGNFLVGGVLMLVVGALWGCGLYGLVVILPGEVGWSALAWGLTSVLMTICAIGMTTSMGAALRKDE